MTQTPRATLTHKQEIPNGSDGYDQLSNDSLSQDTDTNDRISPTSDRDTDSERRNNWQRNHTTGYGTRTTGSSSHTSFQNEQSNYPQMKYSNMLPMWRAMTHPHGMLSTGGVLHHMQNIKPRYQSMQKIQQHQRLPPKQ